MGQPAKWRQQSFRFRNDDGSESAATWRQSENIDDTLQVNTNYRLRFSIDNYGGSSGSVSAQFQYNKEGAGWYDITESSNNIISADSANLADEQATTNQIGGSGTFNAGKCDDADGTGGQTGAISVPADQHTEVEIAFQIVGADVSNNDTIQIRIVHVGGSVLDVYTQTPTITVSKAIPITLYPDGIASAEAFGSAMLGHTLLADTVVSAESVATPVVVQIVKSISIASSETIGSAKANITVKTTGIESAEAIGNATVSAGEQFLQPPGISSAESFGTAKVIAVLSTTGIASAETIGTPSVVLVLEPAAIGSAESFGAPAVSQRLAATGIASAESVSAAKLSHQLRPTSIASAEAFGQAKTAVVIVVSGIESAEYVEPPTMQIALQPPGIGSIEFAGTPQANLWLHPDGIASAESIGDATVIGPQTLFPNGITSAEYVSKPKLSISLSPDGIAPAMAFGMPKANLQLSADSITSEEAIGTVHLLWTQLLRPQGIPSAEAFGSATIYIATIVLLAQSIESSNAFGDAVIAIGPFTLEIFDDVLAVTIVSDSARYSATLSDRVDVEAEVIQ